MGVKDFLEGIHKQLGGGQQDTKPKVVEMTPVRPDESPRLWSSVVRKPPPGVIETPAIEFTPKPPGSFALPAQVADDQRRREVWWSALTKKGTEMELNHRTMAAAMNDLRDAKNDKDLNEGLHYFHGNDSVDVSTATERQQVPDQGGGQVGELFDRDTNQLALSDRDVAGMEGVRAAVRTGEGGVRRADMSAMRSEASVKIAASKLESAMLNMQTLKNEVHRAALHVAAMEEEEEAVENRATIAKLKAEAEATAEKVQNFFDLLSMYGHAKGGASIGLGSGDANGTDAADKAGGFFARIAGHVNDGEIEDAANALQMNVELAAKFQHKSAALELINARNNFANGGRAVAEGLADYRNALTASREAFAELGQRAADSAGPDASQNTRETIGAIMAAIPLASVARDKARQLHDSARVPASDVNAELGLGIATFHHQPAAESFVRASAEIAGAKREAAEEQARWDRRFRSLQLARERMIGRKE